ncbi:MAG: hypothetical protein QOD74_128 [Variibacter sp.]|jgi:hypothetical protein|nr:hypothetical protein [Variibacter sp.]
MAHCLSSLRSRVLAAALIVLAAAPVSAVISLGAGANAEAAEASVTRKRVRGVRTRVAVRTEMVEVLRPQYRTNHIPGVWRGNTRMPWVGPGLCHIPTTSGRGYCILW